MASRRPIIINDHRAGGARRRRHSTTSPTRACVLGPVRFIQHGNEVLLRRPAHRRLAALLLIERGRAVTVDLLAERFWRGSPPRTARRAIHTHISEIRRTLGSAAIETVGDGYRWAHERCSSDMDDFERLVSSAEAAWSRNNLDATLRMATAARRRWVDPPFPELIDDDDARPAVERLRSLARRSAELRAESALGLGRAASVIPDLTAAVLVTPWDERLACLLARAHEAVGHHADALRVIEALQLELANSGLRLPADVADLEQRIRRRHGSIVLAAS